MADSMMITRLTQDDSCFLEQMEKPMEGFGSMTQ